MSAYSLVPGFDAVYKVMDNTASVMLRSESPTKVESAAIGPARVAFVWLPPKGPKRRWRPQPTFISQEPLNFSTSDVDDGSRLYEFAIEDVFPPFGIVKEDCSGLLVAPAVCFSISRGPSIWAILLHSGWTPPKPQMPVSELSSSSEPDAAKALIGLGDSGAVVGEVHVPQEGFDRVRLVMRRELGAFSSEQLLGEVEKGSTKTLLWLPILRDFGTVLICEADSKLGQFSGLLQQLGAEVTTTSLYKANLTQDFVICDGPGMSYHLCLVGEKEGRYDVLDQAPVSLAGSPQGLS